MNSKTAINVLLVEDSQEDVDLITEAFNHNFPVNLSVVMDGEKAISYLNREGEFENSRDTDLVILDLNLPRKNGQEVLQEIKKDSRLCKIPVIVFSTSRSPKDISVSYQNRSNCYICKPLNYEGFLEVVNKIKDFWLNVVQLPGYYQGGNYECQSH